MRIDVLHASMVFIWPGSSVNESILTSDGFLTPKEYRCSKYTPFFFGVREYVKDNPPDWVSL